jgi:hypothetical protein
MAFNITGDHTERMALRGARGARVEVRATALDALAVARLLHEEGYANVRITDTNTGERYDEASLRRAAATEGRTPPG